MQELPLFAALEAASTHYSSRTAVNSGDATISYSELFDTAARIAAVLQANKVRSLALLADNSADWIAVDLACLALNVCCIPLPTFFSVRQLQHTVHAAGADAIVHRRGRNAAFTDGLLVNECALPARDLTLIRLHQEAALPAYQQVRDQLNRFQVSKITFTSGSTGQPKGVCLTQGHLAAVSLALRDRLASLQLGDHISVLPYATLLENIAGIYLCLLRGAAIVIPDMEKLGLAGSSQIASKSFLTLLGQYEFESAILVPQQLKFLLDGISAGQAKPEKAQFIAVGGGRIPTAWIQQARALSLPVYEGYGLSECGSVVSLNTPSEHCDGTAGRALPHVDITVSDGELQVSSTFKARYLPDLLTAEIETDLPESNLIATGDLGHVDEQGYVHITGRKKNVLINSFGRNISPEWVETELLSGDCIQQCIVLGDAHAYCVALIIAPSAATSDAAIDAHVAAINLNLPDYAQVRAWHRLATPFSIDNGLLTANGRLKRELVASEYEQVVEALYSANNVTQPAKTGHVV